MEIAFEIGPTRSLERLKQKIKELEGLVDWVDVPDSPMGTSRFSSPIISCLIKSFSEIPTIAHMRLIDLSRVAAESIMATMTICGVERVALLRGDLVEGSSIIRDVEPETSVELARHVGLRPGLIISLRKTYEEALRRLSLHAEFYLLTNLSENRIDLLELVAREAGSRGARVYPYVIVSSDKSEGELSKILPEARKYSAEGVKKLVDSLSTLSSPPHGLLISSPLAFEEGLKAVKYINRL